MKFYTHITKENYQKKIRREFNRIKIILIIILIFIFQI